MNLTTEHASGIAVVRVGESRLMYPLLSEFSTAVTQLIASGELKVVEAWSCAIINLVGSRQATNGAMLLKHNVLEMLQRLMLLHGTEEMTAGRAMPFPRRTLRAGSCQDC